MPNRGICGRAEEPGVNDNETERRLQEGTSLPWPWEMHRLHLRGEGARLTAGRNQCESNWGVFWDSQMVSTVRGSETWKEEWDEGRKRTRLWRALKSLWRRAGLPRWCQWSRSHLLMQADLRDSFPGFGSCPGGGHGNHSSILAWTIPWTEEPGGLRSTGSHRVGHDWSNLERTRVWASISGTWGTLEDFEAGVESN